MNAIKLTNIEKLKAAFDSVNGKAASFVLSHKAAIERAKYAEDKLKSLNIPKRLWKDAEYHVSSSGPYSNNYKFSAVGTKFAIRHNGRNWSLVNVERIKVHPKSRGQALLKVTEEAQKVMLNNNNIQVITAQ